MIYTTEEILLALKQQRSINLDIENYDLPPELREELGAVYDALDRAVKAFAKAIATAEETQDETTT